MRAKVLTTFATAALLSFLPLLAVADEPGPGGPHPWQVGLNPPASPIMERLTSFHDLLLWVITAITLFVLGLMAYVCWRFAEDKNPVPSRRSHNTLLEVVWTAVPVLILVIIAIPSFKLLYYMDVVPKTEMTLKAIGKQWYWTYEYPDNGNFTFDSYLVAESDLKPGQLRLLETDNHVVLPINTNIRLQTTAADVLHAWALAPTGIKIDAIPGRLNEMWINITEPGTYYGQCSELCGVNHGFMPITVQAVTREAFDAWVTEAQAKFARVGDDGVTVAGTAAQPAHPAN